MNRNCGSIVNPIMYFKTIKKISYCAHNKEHNNFWPPEDPSSWCQQDAASTPHWRRPPPPPRDFPHYHVDSSSKITYYCVPNTSGDLGRGQCTLQTKYLFYAYQLFLYLSALFMLVSTFYACQFFLCLSATEIVRLMLVRVCGKRKIVFTQNDLLFQSGLSGWSYFFRQKAYAWF